MAHPAIDGIDLSGSLEQITGLKLADQPPTILASYESDPDFRLTAAFATTSAAVPTIVVKANRFPLLPHACRVHLTVAASCPSRVPRVIGHAETAEGSLLFLEPFVGTPAAELGVPGLESIARCLAAIQQSVSESDFTMRSVPVVELKTLVQYLSFVQEHISNSFATVWQKDSESKLSQAFGSPIEDVLPLLDRASKQISGWISALHRQRIPLSVHHGDLHSGNAVIQSSGEALIYDWETGSCAHPFLSMEKVLTAAWAQDIGADGGPWGYVRHTPSQDVLKRTYLEQWPGEPESLSHAFDAAMCLAVVYEMKFEIDWALTRGWANGNPEWTAQLLNRLRQHIEKFENAPR